VSKTHAAETLSGRRGREFFAESTSKYLEQNLGVVGARFLEAHKLICKTFSHAGEDTDSDSTIDINVTASVSTTTQPTGS